MRTYGPTVQLIIHTRMVADCLEFLCRGTFHLRNLWPQIIGNLVSLLYFHLLFVYLFRCLTFYDCLAFFREAKSIFHTCTNAQEEHELIIYRKTLPC